MSDSGSGLRSHGSLSLRCLAAGMKPELVDAAFRRKTPNKRAEGPSYDEPFLIDNFQPLERDDISDILMVGQIRCQTFRKLRQQLEKFIVMADIDHSLS